MRREPIIFHLFVAVCLLFVSGCFSSNPEDIAAFVKPQRAIVTAENYILQPPDEVEIFCSEVPEIHEKRQQIRPDGKISFEDVGEIQAAGKTPKELANAMYEKIVMLYTLTGDNPIDVQIRTYTSNVYYVLGEVYFSGPKAVTGRDTLMTVLSDAKVSVTGWKERIQVIRPSADENTKAKIFEFDYDKARAHGDMSQNVLLQEGDIVYVPPTILAGIAMKVEEFVRPIARAFSTVNIISGTPTGR